MKNNLLYLGNKLATKGFTPTSADILPGLLSNDFNVISGSSKVNKILRILDLIHIVIRNRKKCDYVMIDVYSTLSFYYVLILCFICRVYNLKYVPILRGGNLHRRLENSEGLLSYIITNSFTSVCPSKYIYDAFSHVYKGKLVIIPNSIDIDAYTFKYRDIGNEVNLLWVRSFHAMYNPSMAIRVVLGLRNAGLNVRLTMVGPDKDGSLYTTRLLADEMGLAEFIDFPGLLSKKEWVGRASDYHFFLNTTNVDNTPISVIEAMALGLAVISTNSGGMKYLIQDGLNGFTVNPNDHDSMVLILIELLDDTKKMREVLNNARNTALSFSWHEIGAQWKNILIANGNNSN